MTSCRTTNSTSGSSGRWQQIRLTGPTARAVLKRDINSHLPRHDLTLFSQVSSAEMLEGMASFVDKRAPVWPRPT